MKKITVLPLTVLAFSLFTTSVLGYEFNTDNLKDKVNDVVEEQLQNAQISPSITPIKITPMVSIAKDMESIKDQIKDQIKDAVDDLLNQAKTRFEEQFDRIIARLEQTKDRVNNATGLTDEEKAAAIADIDGIIADINAFKDKVEAAQTREDFKALVGEAKSIWKKAVQVHKKYVGLNVTGRFLNHVAKMEEVQSKVEAKLGELEEKGVDVTEVRKAIDGFKVALELAKRDVQDARDLFKAMVPGTDAADENFQQAVSILKNAKEELYDAGMNLRDAVLALRDEVKDLEAQDQ